MQGKDYFKIPTKLIKKCDDSLCNKAKEFYLIKTAFISSIMKLSINAYQIMYDRDLEAKEKNRNYSCIDVYADTLEDLLNMRTKEYKVTFNKDYIINAENDDEAITKAVTEFNEDYHNYDFENIKKYMTLGD